MTLESAHELLAGSCGRPKCSFLWNSLHLQRSSIRFGSSQVSYQQLVDLFFSRHNPTTLNRQKNDVGTQYRSAIFTHNAEQQEVRLPHICASVASLIACALW